MSLLQSIPLDSIQHLVYGTGGANGWIFLGTWLELEREFTAHHRSLHTQLLGMAGSSVGSLFALALSINFTATEFREFLIHAIEKHKDKLVMNVLNLTHKKGIIPMTILEVIVQEMLYIKYDPKTAAGMTLRTLHQLTHKECLILTHNLSYERSEVLDHRTHPDMPVVTAICMSCSIPGVFHAVPYKGCLYSDAGISNALPINFFPIDTTLAFNIFHYHEYKRPEDISMQDFFCRAMATGHTLTQHKIDAVPMAFRHRITSFTVPCNIENYLRQFLMAPKERDHLINIGQKGAKRLFHPEHSVLAHTVALYIQHVLPKTTTTTASDKEIKQ